MRYLFNLSLVLLIFLFSHVAFGQSAPAANPPIYIAFLWHMHQPIYWPYESVVQTDANGRFPFSVTDIHNQRLGPYNSWPKNAVQKGINANMPHFGAQVSFSGSLVENLNALEANGNGNFSNWKSHWNSIKNQNTSLGHPRMDMVGFGYFHPLMGLINYTDIRKQIQRHKQIFSTNFPGAYSKGIFPPENAFAERMIPALVDEGLNWVLIDNVHFDRAAKGYPFNTGGNIYEPNKADVLNSDPNDWIQLQNIWAPTKISAAWGHRPHFVEYVDPNTGQKYRMIAVPASRYLGNEDGRGGFGALSYEAVMSQFEPYNTDPRHPILIVLHHDGDNYGGGTDSYYGSNFQNFVNWLAANPSRFVCTTIEDYLQMFPPDANSVIHVEPGSWSGADNGDPEFKKWLGDPGGDGYSPDINSWGVLTAAQNFVHTAEQVDPNSQNTQSAWKYLLVSESSDYWYWDGSLGGIWDSNPTRGANQAVSFASQVIANATDNTPPTIFIPQREPYNPGGTEWNQQMPSDFKVWTYAYDVSGLSSVKLYYRKDLDGVNSTASTDNEIYAGGPEVGEWVSVEMTGTSKISMTNPAPTVKAKEYSATVAGFSNKLIDYYVEATDSRGNVARTPIQHVWVGAHSGGGGGNNGFVIDGNLDEGAVSVAQNNGTNLYLGWKEGKLYLATESAQNKGKDVFIVISDSLRPPKAAMWAKSGMVSEWSLFLGNESTNNWSGWFDASSSPANAAGSVVEGLLDVQAEFGRVPGKLYIAVLHYSTPDGGVLENQVPAGNGNGNLEPDEFYEFDFSLTGVKDLPLSSELPGSYGLAQNFPNPFNPSTKIQYSVQEEGKVSLVVYDLLGRVAATLVDGYKPAGTYEVNFDASALSGGVYFYSVSVNGFRETKKMILNK
ncbi:MAG: T9SS type A sorting domain-containing protein [Ignavibacteriales bacterium]|nr:T9SS type A sorting domain-containing protein [Ignavibacteria bacterium]MCZ2143433.1 T9SS type A sorting domain-containing protein [Ignavibacteriales bacterium]WKZ72244.1 MAG: T9SS type A sorting domain-containing protein [Ignavibacteriaceae bacterium]